MEDSYFDLIAQELLKQQHHMEQLMRENQELRHQLAQLRAGKGIFIAIGGQQIALMEEESLSAAPPTMTAHSQAPLQAAASSIGAAATALAEPSNHHRAVSAPAQENEGIDLPSFLEEIMLDEFAAAMTNPVAAIVAPAKKNEPTSAPLSLPSPTNNAASLVVEGDNVRQIEDEQKAALRRELMGSYMLE
ncbi:MAG TPA: hypothetical protein VKR06_43000 [Ktedonosporobacter sp.]|nr:hypothetical protein [Ktedonosporobacter sp.]